MKAPNNYSTISTIIIVSVILLFGVLGCSNDSSPLSSSAENTFNASRDLDYPELTPEFLASQLPPGFQIVQLRESNSLDDLPCSMVYDQRQVRPNQVGNLNIQGGIRMIIPAGSVSQTITVRMVAPIGCLGVIDCYPHPYQFNNMIEIRWRLDQLAIDESLWDDLVPYYWNENTHHLDVMPDSYLDNDELVMHTNHFSRYVLGLPGGG